MKKNKKLHMKLLDDINHHTNPNAYGSSQAGKRKVIEGYLNDILSLLTNKTAGPLRILSAAER